MFRCTVCKEVAPAGVKPVMVTTSIREVDYTNIRIVLDEYEREHKEPIHSVGTEIVAEAKACPKCAGVEEEVEVAKPKVIGKSHKHEEKVPVPLRPAFAAFAATKVLDYIEDPIVMAVPERRNMVEVIKGFVERNPKFYF